MAPVSFLSGSQGVQFSLYMENHPRYRLRMIAIGSVVIGLFFNILAIAISHQYILQGLAFVPNAENSSLSAIHGFIAIHNIFQLLTASENALSVCPECSCHWKGKHTEPREATDRAHYSLLGQKDDHEYDPEADAEKDSNAGKENAHAPPASD
ncbi:hypothetical protein MMC22_005526 [Lobaria immixta]|nr:hypothetical protein [Lobaria immixta]